MPGRSLLVVTPISADAARRSGLPIAVSAPGLGVRQATCVTTVVTQQLCGQPNDPGVGRLTSWQGVPVVVLQADLPS